MHPAEQAAEIARLRRDLAATEQRLIDTEARLARVQPVADAAHAYCAAWETVGPVNRTVDARVALFAAHRATTPSATPSTRTVVAVGELERRKRPDRDCIAHALHEEGKRRRTCNDAWHDWAAHHGEADAVLAAIGGA